MKPIVAIVGRPNVGKSSLFNRIVGRRLAVVDDEPGVTRDRNYASTRWRGKSFVMVDTGGYVPSSRIEIERFAREQAEIAMAQADVILFVVDVSAGISDTDGQIARILRKRQPSCLVVANKADSEAREFEAAVFGRLGLGEPIAVSALNGRGTGDLLDQTVSLLPDQVEQTEAEDTVRIAVVGRPNAGKSSLVNVVCGERRTIVHESPGTTRDAVDTKIVYKGHPLTLVDTAGLRGMRKIRKEVEFYASLRTIRSLQRCDVALVIADCGLGVALQDIKIVGQAMDFGKGAALVANKWDLVEKDTYTADRFVKDIREAYPSIAHVPVVLTSALSGRRTHRALDVALQVHERCTQRVATSQLNDLVETLKAENPPRFRGGRQAKVLYCTQHGIQPPSFVCFCSDPKLIDKTYLRYLENQIRQNFGFEGCPVNIRLRRRSPSSRRNRSL